MSYPLADKERLFAIAQWLIVLFAWDDILDDLLEDHLMDDANGVKEMTKLMDPVLDHPETSEIQAEHPVVAAFRGYVNPLAHRICSPYLIFGHLVFRYRFSARFRATSTPTIRQRFADAVRQYAQAAAELVHNREKRRSPRVEEFIAMRRATSACEVLQYPESL